MRLLHVISSMDPRAGGTSEGIRSLTPPLHEKGHDVEIICLDDPQADYLTKETLHIHALGKGRSSWAYHSALLPWLEKNLPRFDAVIQNGLWQYPSYVLQRVAARTGIPYFVFPHGMLDPWFQRAPGRRLKAIRNWFYWKLIEQRVISRAEAVLFTCAEEMRLAQNTFHPYQPKHQINVGYGISQPPSSSEEMMDAFAQKCPELGFRDIPFFLFLGRIHPKKGVDILIKAYAAIYHANPTANSQQPTAFPLVIAGPGLETEYGKEMQKLASDLCPPSSVFWPGMLTGDAKWGALYRADAFVLPSHQENFGIAVVEALACVTPVLISNQINIWREIEQDKAGLVDDDTLAGTENLFRRWKNLSPKEKDTMKLAAKASYANRFGVAGAASNLMAIIKEFKDTSGGDEH